MSDYWDERAKKEYEYKGEKFYTITAIPYYYKRRKYVVNNLLKTIKLHSCEKICDMGCGDGEYIKLLSEKTQKKSYTGIDASMEMIEVAKRRNASISGENIVKYYVSSTGIKNAEKFDMIYMIAVCAHLTNEVLENLVENAFAHLKSGGVFVIFEQTAPFEYGGKGYRRRTCEQYCTLINNAGLKTENIKIVDFWLHRLLLEKHLIKWICKQKADISSDDVRINLNTKWWYRRLSELLSFLSIPHVFNGVTKNSCNNRWGYCLVKARKEE